jgi:hypothetical protein
MDPELVWMIWTTDNGNNRSRWGGSFLSVLLKVRTLPRQSRDKYVCGYVNSFPFVAKATSISLRENEKREI